VTHMEIITIIKDLILASAAITGSIVAVKGLGTWQRQLKGQSEYELSRRILVSLFKYRDSINGVRHPAMWAYEMPNPPEEEAKIMSREQISFYGTSKAYQARWDKVQEQKTALYADLLEAEAIWGMDLKNLFQSVFDLEHELVTQIRHYLELINTDVKEYRKDAIRKIDENKRDVMYDLSSDEPDEYKKDLLEAITAIEIYLKAKLSHEKT
jgi:hypothetical protein